MQRCLPDPDAPVTLAAVSELLHAYSRVTLPGQVFAKAFYPSGGTLYPVQVYVQIAAQRVQLPAGGYVSAGYYYYQPLTRQLIALGTGASGGEPQSPLRIFFVADGSAIEPLYGSMSEVLCRLEAGYMAHLLEHSGAMAVRAEAVDELDCKAMPRMHAQHRLLAVYGASAAKLVVQESQLPTRAPIEVQRCDSGGCEFALGSALGAVELGRVARKSYRSHSSEPPTLENLLSMLAAADALTSDTELSLYLHLRKTVASSAGAHSLEPGIYSCQGTRLVLVQSAPAELVLFPGQNSAIEKSASFSVLLIGSREHAERKYAGAGMIGQVLSNYGVALRIGLCALGLPDTGPIERALQLSDRQQVYHALLGGAVSAAQIAAVEESAPPRADLLEELTQYLRAGLPHYMIPQQLIAIARVPLTQNGKVDRNALPAPDSSDRSAPSFERPQGQIEEALAAIWQELLQVERVGRHDNFFQLGGASLLVIKSVTRVRQVLGVELPVRAVFTAPTVSELGAQIEASLPQCVAADAAYESGVI